jgi:exonuclease III
MCLNGWGGRLYDRLIPYIEATSPDVLCLQEVIHTPHTSSEWLTYRDGDHVLPQRANFFREVAAALPDHVASFCPAAQGVLWDDEKPQRVMRASMRCLSSPSSSGVKRLKSGAMKVGKARSTSTLNAIHASQT